MSKGPGKVIRAITTAFDEDPTKWWTVEELVVRAYGDPEKTYARVSAVSRALRRIPDVLRRDMRGDVRPCGTRHGGQQTYSYRRVLAISVTAIGCT